MEKQMLKSVELRRGEEQPPGDVRQAVTELWEAGLDLGILSLQAAERQLDAAIYLSEQVRDDLLGAQTEGRAQRQRGLAGELRQDAHRIVDVIADLAVYLLELGARERQQDTSLKAGVKAVEGIGEAYAARLAKAGIYRCEQLLAVAAAPQGREALAEKTGISSGRLLTWINHIDLFRIRGVGEEYASLLEEAGVDSVPELAQRNPASLHARLREVNEAKVEVRRLPPANQVANWIRQAATLPPVVIH